MLIHMPVFIKLYMFKKCFLIKYLIIECYSLNKCWKMLFLLINSVSEKIE